MGAGEELPKATGEKGANIGSDTCEHTWLGGEPNVWAPS